jgi:hypothetical protein
MIDKNNTTTILKFVDLKKERTKIKRSFSILMMILSLIAFFASVNQIYAAEQEEITTLIETAKTPEDHIKIAEYYDTQAAKAEQKAYKHAAMASAYKERSKPMPGMVRHCTDLVKDYKAEAAEYSKMAAEHRKMAQELQAQ